MGHDNEFDEDEPFVEEFASEDDFGEEEDLFEETPYSDEGFSEEEYLAEEWEEGELEGFEDDGIEDAPKKKLPSNAVIIGGGAVFVLIILFMMGGGGSEVPPAQPAPGAPAASKPVGPAPTQLDYVYGNKEKAADEETVDLTQGLMHDEEAIKKIENIKDEFVFEGYVGVDEEAITSSETEMMPTEVEDPPMPAPMAQTGAPVPRAPDGPLTPMPEGAAISEDKGNGDTQVKSSPSALVPDSAVMAEISKIAKTVSRIDQRLSDIEETVESFDPVSIKSQLSRLESRVDDIESGPQKKKPAESKASVIKKPAVAVPLPTRAPQRPGPWGRTAAENTDWLLKGARPGEAVVSRKGSEELKVVYEGDQLSGLGTIQTIRLEDDMWVVRGEKAMIKQ